MSDYRVVDRRDQHAAELYRHRQAEELLREAGFTEAPDGRWVLLEDAVVRRDELPGHDG